MTKYFKNFLFCIIFLSGFLLWGNAQAATTYYVQSTCEAGITTYNPATYSCTGGSATVFPTIMGAINTLNLEGDDVLEVRADSEGGSKTYYEGVTIGSADSGDDGKNVIIRARAGDTITVDGSDIRRFGISVAGNNITVDGFHVDNIMPTTIASYALSASTNGQRNITLQNNTVNISLSGGQTNQVRCGIVVGGSSWDGRTYNITVQGNTITTDTDAVDDQTDMFRGNNVEGLILDGNYAVNNNSTTGGNHNDVYQMFNVKNGTFKNNYGNSAQNRNFQQTFFLELYNNGTDEVPTDYGHHKIYNNVFVGYGGGYVFYLLARKGDTNTASTATAEVYNNTIHAFENSISSTFISADFKNIIIKNNIIIGERTASPWYAISVIDETIVQDPIVSDHNIFYTTAGPSVDMSFMDEDTYTFADHKAAGYDLNSYFVDPSLDANYKSNAAEDPAVGKGEDLSAIIGTTDKDGKERSAWDIGAYEYVGASDIVAPAAPSGLSVS